jgi:hypothetical protein
METQQVMPRLRVEPGEVVAAVEGVGKSNAVLSNQALYLYPAKPLKPGELLAPRLRIPLPGKVGDLRNVELIESDNGCLVALLFAARSAGPTGTAPFQVLLRAHDDGRIETIHRRALRFDYPALYRYRAWWISPALYTVRERARNLFAPPLPLDVTDAPPIPRSMRCLAAVLALLSLVLAARRTAGTALSLRARLIWIVSCGLGGLPALGSLWLMAPTRVPTRAS